jgi:hypothetical protein
MARKTSFIAPLLAIAIGLSACKGDDDDDTTTPDTGTPDTGTPDTGTPDTGTPDTGVIGACDPYDGTGCANADEYCVFVVQQNMFACRTLPAMNAHETACSQTLNDCAPGYACADLGSGSLCYKTCNQTGGTECGAVTGMSPDYVCTTIRIDNQDSVVGLCAGQDLCNPAEKAAACPGGETCTLVGNAETGCQPSGNAAVGQACSQADNCMAGGICLNVGNGLTCYEACDTPNPCTNGTDRCQGLMNLPWGICIPMGTACDPLNMPCMAGMTCSLLTGQPECTTSGTAMVGQMCDQATQCVDAAVCVFLNGAPNPLCYEPCDLNAPACTAGQCQNIGLTFGICVP